MDTKTIYTRLNKVFRDVFDDDSITVNPKTTADDIDDWDSLEHITLINAVEREFKMKFKMGEISSMKIVGESMVGAEKYGYVLPFEFISIFLLACIIGGIVISRKE